MEETRALPLEALDSNPRSAVEELGDLSDLSKPLFLLCSLHAEAGVQESKMWNLISAFRTQRQAGLCEFKASLVVYRVSLRSARIT